MSRHSCEHQFLAWFHILLCFDYFSYLVCVCLEFVQHFCSQCQKQRLELDYCRHNCMVCQKRYSIQDYPKEYVNEHFCINCGQHYNKIHRNKGRCNDYIKNGECSHRHYCLVKKITLPCGHNICQRCREQWRENIHHLLGRDVVNVMRIIKWMV